MQMANAMRLIHSQCHAVPRRVIGGVHWPAGSEELVIGMNNRIERHLYMVYFFIPDAGFLHSRGAELFETAVDVMLCVWVPDQRWHN